MVKFHTKEKAELIYPRGIVNPENWLRFMELRAFARRREELKFTDNDIRVLQIVIMAAPTACPVISGTGGLHKIRFSRSEENRGKSGSYRVLYVYFPQSGLVVLVTAYGKNEKGNIDAADKKVFRQLITDIEKGLSEESKKSR